MPTPTKPVIVLENEKKSHRTKEELALRKQGEAALQTGKKLTERPEVRAVPAAHREYRRLYPLLEAIGKNDALYTGIINRYCLLYAECLELGQRRESILREVEALQAEREAGGIPAAEYLRLLTELQKSAGALDSLCTTKRRMMLDIEKECVMTVAAALRSIPKKPEKEDQEDPMAALLAKRRA